MQVNRVSVFDHFEEKFDRVKSSDVLVWFLNCLVRLNEQVGGGSLRGRRIELDFGNSYFYFPNEEFCARRVSLEHDGMVKVTLRDLADESYLGFYNQLIGDEGVNELSKALVLPDCCLSDTDLDNNHIGLEGGRILAKALEKNTSVVSLHLRKNAIGDEGARAFGDMLAINCTLRVLDLSSNELTPKGFHFLLNGVLRNKNSALNRWYLSGNLIQISEELLNLREMRKRLQDPSEIDLENRTVSLLFLETFVFEPVFTQNKKEEEEEKKRLVVKLSHLKLLDDNRNFQLLNPKENLERCIQSLLKTRDRFGARERVERRIKLDFGSSVLFTPSKRVVSTMCQLILEGVLSLNLSCLDASSPSYTKITDSMLLVRLVEDSPFALKFYNTTLEEVGPKNLIIQKRIGGGNFGDVFLALYEKAVTVVVKTLKLRETETPETQKFALDNFLIESAIACTIPPHPLILKHYLLLNCASQAKKENEEEDNNTVELGGIKGAQYLLITDYAPLGSLDDFLYKERDRKGEVVDSVTRTKIALQVAGGVTHLHRHGFIHRDLAVRNVLVLSSSPQVLLCDFGLTVFVPALEFEGLHLVPRASNKLLFPIRSLPPEVLEADAEGNLRFSAKSDVWAFGVFLWELYTFAEEFPRIVQVMKENKLQLKMEGDFSKDIGKNVPFWDRARSTEAIQRYICRDCIVNTEGILPKPELCPPEVYSVINCCLSYDASKRPSMQIVKETLSHIVKDQVDAKESREEKPHSKVSVEVDLPSAVTSKTNLSTPIAPTAGINLFHEEKEEKEEEEEKRKERQREEERKRKKEGIKEAKRNYLKSRQDRLRFQKNFLQLQEEKTRKIEEKEKEIEEGARQLELREEKERESMEAKINLQREVEKEENLIMKKREKRIKKGSLSSASSSPSPSREKLEQEILLKRKERGKKEDLTRFTSRSQYYDKI